MAKHPDKDRIDWLEKHGEMEVSKSWDEDNEWLVHSVNGGRNDREWTLVAAGVSVREAIDKAMIRKP